MRARGWKKECGFTLLEMMVAISVLALILIMIAGSFSAVAHSKVQGEDHLATDREARAIVWELSNEIRGAVQTPRIPTSRVLLLGRGQMRGRFAADSITVSTLAAGHRRSIIGLGSENLVSYDVTPTPRRSGWYTLTRTQMSALLSTGGTGSVPAPRVVLASNVVSLHIRYFNGNDWLESWDSTAIAPSANNGQLPIAVSIDLLLASANGRVMEYSTEVTLPMAVAQW